MYVAVLIGGCAVASKPGFANGGGDGGLMLLDSTGSGMQIDAKSWMDAPPVGMTNVTMSETTDSTIAAGMSLSCGSCQSSDSPCSDYRTDENAYYRVFSPSDYGVTGTLHVTQVAFGVSEAGGTQSVQVKIGTYNGTPGTTLNTGTNDWAGGNVTAVNSSTVNVPAVGTTGEMVSAPITGDIPASSKLIVEVFSPSHTQTANTYFFLGGTSSGETKPGYIRAPGCSVNTPTTPGSISQSVEFIITVSGTY
jgi:hypothetical protein